MGNLRSETLLPASARLSLILSIVMQIFSKVMLVEVQAVPAIFMFGDSYGDTGNNDYIPTAARANFPPYGRDFEFGIPTGRVSNGKLMSDFFVEGLGIKELLPPYLSPTVQPEDLLTGVCFGSSGTGLDNLTAALLSVIPFWKQVELFKEYTTRIVALVGEESATTIIKEAIIFIVIGTNDFIVTYYENPTRPSQFTVPQYTNFLLNSYTDYIKELYGLNARKIALINVPPLGCLPYERTQTYVLSRGACSQQRNMDAAGFNSGLNDRIPELKSSLPELRIVTLDYNNLILDAIRNPQNYGFEVVARGCCGTGTYETGFLCTEVNPLTCTDASKYLFFDSVHLSQTAYQNFSNVFLTRDIPQLF